MIDPLFVGEKYNILTDKVEKVLPSDKRILEEVFLAYCQILKVKMAFRPTRLGDQLEEVHIRLLKRIKELEPIESGSNNS